MTGYLYEKDLTPMKFRILESPRHALLVRVLAERFGISVQEMRRILIGRFDMQMLENLPSRYEAGLEHADADSRIGRLLGCELFSRYVPLAASEAADAVLHVVEDRIAAGEPEAEALAAGTKAFATEVRR
jgi:energy-converting hydrogenase A subunit M